ncbi:NUDIX hydrolase [Pseudooctadecabacter jejudonensis]|uniref:NUDIX domain protein n=1 Tax=Pseudooctadecabacter jejudonensis TaxID=1391910 RepID=A0A1Y5RV41_9RHOB|nr:NUDIX hydrolase [Pseudooctadecabacter jejudonensis]SLN23296.1 NUDIX domain protein [Pseudooctadecabacter jejudonensis]
MGAAHAWIRGHQLTPHRGDRPITNHQNTPAIRDAATVIIVRDTATAPRILMGQRGANAAFMPNKFVFPGGAVDDGDTDVPLQSPLRADVATALTQDSHLPPHALAAAAVREVWEETGLIIGDPALWPDAPADWQDFAAHGYRPSAAHFDFIFRAVTPQGRPRRFDARFFCLDARHIRTDLDDFSRAEDELSHLQWVPLPDARSLDLPFITEVVLAELSARLQGRKTPDIPFFRNEDEAHLVTRLAGKRPLDP